MKVQDEKIERFVLRMSENSNDATSFVIKLQGLAITSLRFISDDRGNLIGAGFYKEPNKTNQIGFFAYRIDQQTQGFRKWEFSVNKDQYQMMHAYTDESGKYVSGTRQMRDYVLDHLVWDDEQGLTMVAEQRIFLQDEDNYNDIMIIQLDTNFQKKFTVRIPKKQSALWSIPDFASYQFLRRGQRQFVIFNDLVDNIPTEAGLPKRIKEMDLFLQGQRSRSGIHLVEIENTGRIKHQDLKPVIQAGADMGLVPSMTRSDGDNVFLLYLSYLNNPGLTGKVYPISWMSK